MSHMRKKNNDLKTMEAKPFDMKELKNPSFYKDVIPIVAFGIIYYIAFVIIEQVPRGYFAVVHCALDDVIPFFAPFIVPYYAWFIYMAVGAGCFYLFDRQIFYRVTTMLIIGMSVFIILSICFPNMQPLRPSIVPTDNIFGRMVSFLYQTDTDTDVFPSMHVFNTLAIMCGAIKSRSWEFQHKWLVNVFVVVGIFIILSTMFLKQHSVIDALGAVALFIVLYFCIYMKDFSLYMKSQRPIN